MPVETSTGWRALPIPEEIRPALADTSADSLREHMIQIRRDGHQVTVRGLLKFASTDFGLQGRARAFLEIPSGFRDSKATRSAYWSYYTDCTQHMSYRPRSAGGVQYYPWMQLLFATDLAPTSAWTEGCGFTLTWPTDEPWPTVLPGTAA